MTTERRKCRNCHGDFRIESEDLDFYKRIDVPIPTMCPECRLQRRMMWRNELTLHKRRSSLSGEEVISQFPDDAPFPVYGPKEYFARDWTPPGAEYDPNRGFFEQFRALFLKTPQCALLTDLQSMESGSIYQNGASRNKNCYMVSASGDNEDCLYSNNLDYSRSAADCLWCRRIEAAYENIGSLDSSRLFFSEECEQCANGWLLYDCRGCTDCFGCAGLRNKSHCLWNEQLTKEQWESEVKNITADLTREKIAALGKKLDDIKLTLPRKYAHVDQGSSATCTGDYIAHSKNVSSGFTVHESQNSRYCSKLISGKDCWDMTDWGDPAELCYECITVGKNAHKVMFSNNCWPECRDIQYCDSCANSHDLFGCIGWKGASYRILNKQYSEGEYRSLRSRIIEDMKRRGEYGEFFPPELAPFAYNESIAYGHFPMTEDEAKRRGYAWSLPEGRDYKPTKNAGSLPRTIKNAGDGVLNEVIGCAHAGKCPHGCATAFRITKEELAFYKRFGLPLPELCFACRHAERSARRNPMKLWHRQCMCEKPGHFHGEGKCPNEFETSYAPERPEVVYCEQCYNSEVV